MIEKKTVYISGPMSGLPYYNIDAFIDAEYALKAAGFVPFNPTWLVSAAQSGWEYKDLMVMDMAALSRCSYIYQLDGWENSKGACAEWEFAKSVGIKVVNKSWLDWYVKQIAEFEKRKEEESDFMTKCLNKPVVKNLENRCDNCKYYCGLYGIEGRDYCLEHRCNVMWNAYCDKHIFKEAEEEKSDFIPEKNLIKEPNKRCNTCEHYEGFYGLEGRAECSYYGYSLVGSDYTCKHYVLKGEKKDEKKEEVNEGKMQEVGQTGGEVQDEEGRSS